VAALPWNQWQASSGITGNLGLEYADKRLDLTLGEGRGRFVLKAVLSYGAATARFDHKADPLHRGKSSRRLRQGPHLESR